MASQALRLCVVEDDDFQRRMMCRMLKSAGYMDVAEAKDGQEALEIMRASGVQPADVVICDLDMPGMDGLEFARRLSEEQTRMAVIIVSALSHKLLSTAELMARMYHVNLLGVIEKPVSLNRLETLLNLYSRSVRESARPKKGRTFSFEEILDGLRSNQFVPYLQPQVALATGQLVGVEVLARWIHPREGLVPPDAFIPQLERQGEIDVLSFQMLEAALTLQKRLRDQGRTMDFSVNISLSSLTDLTFAERMTDFVRASGFDARGIILEVTETTAATHEARALENLGRLCMNGFRLSIDDYGTGYSNLQQLTRIPFSELKIDQSFIRGAATNESLQIVIESSIEMARKLQVDSVAEGVETQAQWDWLKSAGCDRAQGYFIARPMDSQAFQAYLQQYRPPGSL